MSETYSKPRQTAEIAFGKTQSQYLARDRAVEEVNEIVQAREEKTLRLREAREAKEASDRLRAEAANAAKRPKKV